MSMVAWNRLCQLKEDSGVDLHQLVSLQEAITTKRLVQVHGAARSSLGVELVEVGVVFGKNLF